jgi:hypothetical protein
MGWDRNVLTWSHDNGECIVVKRRFTCNDHGGKQLVDELNQPSLKIEDNHTLASAALSQIMRMFAIVEKIIVDCSPMTTIRREFKESLGAEMDGSGIMPDFGENTK